MATEREQRLDEQTLRNWPLPMPQTAADKEERGRVLIVAGSREMPGVAVLCADAAFRAGAGKVAIGVGESFATAVGMAVPEARVIALPETPAGGIARAAHDRLVKEAEGVDSFLAGPGMLDGESVCERVIALLPVLAHARVILDAIAMDVLCTGKKRVDRFGMPVLLTPHAGEMAHLTGKTKESIEADQRTTALEASSRWNAIIALKGSTTVISAPDGRHWRHDGGHIGLAASGSGDVLAGLIAGFAARGAPLEQACAWAVVLHAQAGTRLAEKIGEVGYRAREIADEVPGLMTRIQEREQERT